MKKVLEHHDWRVYYQWCWGNESEFIAEFLTKTEAEAYIRKTGKRFNGFEGYDVFEPFELIEEDGKKVFHWLS